MVLTLALALTTVPQKAFGEREHMLVMFLAPYLALAGLRLRHEHGVMRGLAIAAGLLAGLGLCFKPFFLAIPVCVELVIEITQRRIDVRRPELLALLLPVIVFPFLVLWLAPDYVWNIVPLALLTYPGFAPIPYMAAVLKPLAVLAAAGGVTALALWWSNDVRLPDALVWLAAAAGAYVAYMAQHKGFLYQVYPAFAFALVGVAMAGVGHRWRPLRLVAAPALLLVGVLLGYKMWKDERASAADLQALFQADQPKSLMMITADMALPFPYMEDKSVVWASSFQSLWMLPAATDGFLPEAKARDVIARTAELVGHDLQSYAPDYVVVDRNDVRTPVAKEIPFLDLFRSNADFAAAWSHYTLVRSANKKELWRRTG